MGKIKDLPTLALMVCTLLIEKIVINLDVAGSVLTLEPLLHDSFEGFVPQNSFGYRRGVLTSSIGVRVGRCLDSFWEGTGFFDVMMLCFIK